MVACPSPADLAVSGPRAYVASLADSQGLGAVVDLSDPAAPRLMTGRGAGGRHQGIGLYGETAITTASIDALIGFDISDADAPPGPPSARITGLLGHAYSRIWMEGFYAYTLLGQSVRSLQIVNLADSSLRSSGAVSGEFCVHGGYLYARQPKGADMGLAVFGLDKPDEPVLRGYAVHNELLSPQGDDPQGILGMAASGDYVFVANGAKGFARFNVANPAAPYYAGSVMPNGMTSVWEVAVSGATLVVAGDTATGHSVAVYSLKP
ncbi:MAG: hypothetical protein JNG85_14035 [Spirochaetaceae bacterium]|nr:hypothetical protein [Spirochaetaceae bacterium]